MASTSEALITTELAMTVASALTADTLDQFVMNLPAESVPLYLARLVDAATNIRALTKGLEARLVGDGQTGKRFTVEGVEYGFFGAQRKGYADFPGLVRFLIEDCGISQVAIAGAVSDARVTDLREAANQITDMAKREAALAEIDDHRVPKGARGDPSFKVISEYMKGEQ